jgi:hypothetical protein
MTLPLHQQAVVWSHSRPVQGRFNRLGELGGPLGRRILGEKSGGGNEVLPSQPLGHEVDGGQG